jgi:cytochrome P450
MVDTIQCGPLKMRKGDPFSVGMYALCNNPDEWIEPGRFIPERFDKNSEYFLTPGGKTRNPYSFSPFLGGSRICIGKTFVETVSKLTLPTLLTKFKFEFLEGVNPETFEYPHNNMTSKSIPDIRVRISKQDHEFVAA